MVTNQITDGWSIISWESITVCYQLLLLTRYPSLLVLNFFAQTKKNSAFSGKELGACIFYRPVLSSRYASWTAWNHSSWIGAVKQQADVAALCECNNTIAPEKGYSQHVFIILHPTSNFWIFPCKLTWKEDNVDLIPISRGCQ